MTIFGRQGPRPVGPWALPRPLAAGHTEGMSEKKSARRILFGVVAAALAAGVMTRRASVEGDAAPAIVEADEQLRDAVASLPPAVPPSVAAPSRVAIWASPALRRKEAEKVLLSRRRARAEASAESR
jgi:hypothetical protein